jgi:hypothetical protein
LFEEKRLFHMSSAIVAALVLPTYALAAATPASAAPTAEQRQFVRQQLDRLKVNNVFGDAKPADPKVVVDAFVAKGKPLLPALQEALSGNQGTARDVLSRAILLLSWGFDPDEMISKAIAKETHGKPLQKSVKPKAMTDTAVARVLPNVKPYELVLDNDGGPETGTLKMHNIVLLGHDGNATILSTPVAVSNYFKAAHRPATQPSATPAAAVEESYVRDLLTTWLTLSALVSSDSKQSFGVAQDTFKISRNGPRWVASGRITPSTADPQKPNERQLLLVLSPDGAVLNVSEMANLRPLKK